MRMQIINENKVFSNVLINKLVSSKKCIHNPNYFFTTNQNRSLLVSLRLWRSTYFLSRKKDNVPLSTINYKQFNFNNYLFNEINIRHIEQMIHLRLDPIQRIHASQASQLMHL